MIVDSRIADNNPSIIELLITTTYDPKILTDIFKLKEVKQIMIYETLLNFMQLRNKYRLMKSAESTI